MNILSNLYNNLFEDIDIESKLLNGIFDDKFSSELINIIKEYLLSIILNKNREWMNQYLHINCSNTEKRLIDFKSIQDIDIYIHFTKGYSIIYFKILPKGEFAKWKYTILYSFNHSKKFDGFICNKETTKYLKNQMYIFLDTYNTNIKPIHNLSNELDLWI